MPSDEDSAAAARRRTPPVDPRLLRYAGASRGFFAAIAVIAAAQTVTIIAFAWLLTRGIVGAVDGMPWPELTATLGYLAGTVGIRALLVWLREVVAARAAATVEQQLRARLVESVGILGPGWLETRSTAQIAVTAGRGLDALDAYFGRYLPQLVQTIIATPVILLVMWWQDWVSGLIVLLTIPLIPIFMVLIGLATRAVQDRQWKTLQRLATRFADTVQGLSTLKVFGRQHRAAASIEKVTETYRAETMKVLRVSFLSGFALEFLASISVAIVAVSIGFRLLDGSLALGVGLFVLLLAPEAYLPLRQVGVQFHAAAEGVAATDDVFEVLEAARVSTRGSAAHSTAETSTPALQRTQRTETPRHDTSTPAVERAQRVETGSRSAPLILDAVRVRRGERMLPPVDLVATPGGVTLVEGPSGAGKSSLLAALRGAADFEGDASFAGCDVRALAPSEWLAWAGQRPGLIAGTVSANVTLGGLEHDDALVRRALDLAVAQGIEPTLPLGVQGAGLSGGQAQRVAVARAFYRFLSGAAGVIALDEPSSALDAATEADLWTSVRMLADDGAAVILVSHRTSARDIADAVVRLGPASAQAAAQIGAEVVA